MLARLLLGKHFQILKWYFLPHTNTVILLDLYSGIVKETGFFPWVPKLLRKFESKHWFPCGADGGSFVC